jgi:hypothetical protein
LVRRNYFPAKRHYVFTFNYLADAQHTCGGYCGFAVGGSATVTQNGSAIFRAQYVGEALAYEHFSAGDVISLSGTLTAGVTIDSPFVQPNGFGHIDRFALLQVYLDPIVPSFAELLGVGGTGAQAQEDFSGPYYTTESGFSYLTPPASIPEPPTRSLLFGGTSSIIVMRTLRQLLAARKCQENLDAQAETERV